MTTDIEIARGATLRPIAAVAATLGIPDDAVEPYGRDKAKLDLAWLRRHERVSPRGKLILVTAINPTPAGEGKTTNSVGLADALNRAGRKTVLCLREPSLGPCFGQKGGATAVAMRRWCRWRISTSISPAISTPSPRRTTCSRR